MILTLPRTVSSLNELDVFYSEHESLHAGRRIGVFAKEMDGFYYFWPDHTRGGFWSDVVLREVADALTEQNKAWAEFIERELASSGKPLSVVRG